jgi:hypothetical protein
MATIGMKEQALSEWYVYYAFRRIHKQKTVRQTNIKTGVIVLKLNKGAILKLVTIQDNLLFFLLKRALIHMLIILY